MTHSFGYAKKIFLCVLLLAITACTPTRTPSQPSWSVEFWQNGQVVQPDGETVHLQRAPFTLRVQLPKPDTLRLNVSDQPTQYELIQPRVMLDQGCAERNHAFCDYFAYTVAEKPLNEEQSLYIDTTAGLAFHTIYYNGPEDHRWSRVTIDTNQAVVLERDVSVLALAGPAGTEHVHIQEFGGTWLYLVFLYKQNDEPLIGPEELQKWIIEFDPNPAPPADMPTH